MDTRIALERLKAVEPQLRAQGVASLFAFGSVARGEAVDGSDVDLFFDDAPEGRLSLLDVIGIRQYIEDVLGVRVDLITRDSLHPLLRADIEAEAIPVF